MSGHLRLLTIGLALGTTGCVPPSGDAAQSSAPLFTNGGFESGNFTGWTKSTFLNTTGLAAVPPNSTAQLQLAAGGVDFTNALTNGTPQSQLPSAGPAPMNTLAAGPGVPEWPRFGMTSVAINQYGQAGNPHQGANKNVNSIKQQSTTTLADVDPNDGKVHVRFVLAPELEAAGHAPAFQPYFFVAVRNASRAGLEFFTDFNFANQPGVPWGSQLSSGAAGTAQSLLYTDWQIFDVVPPDDKFVLGETLEVEVFASGCQPGGHSGTAYVDGFGEKLPSLFISKTAPTQANIDTDITYTFVVQNNTSGIAPNVVADEVLPPNATFVSINAPAPAMCVTPAVGASGTVSCTFGWMNPGASFPFSVTVHNFTPVSQGRATAGAAATLTDGTQIWTANAFRGYTVYLVGGTGAGQQALIASNTANTLNVIPNWVTPPNATTLYKIVNPPAVVSTATAGGAATLTDTAENNLWSLNHWLGAQVTLVAGTGANQQRTIGSSTTNPFQLTTTANWGATPDATSVYVINQPVSSIINGNYGIAGPTVSRLLGPKRITTIGQGGVFSDLQITKNDNRPAVIWGGSTSYTITVVNNGPSVANGATVQDTLPAQISLATWTCAGANGGTCAAPSGAGSINTTVSLPVNGSATFTVSATIAAGSGFALLSNTATVATPAGVTDPFPQSNASTDQDGISTTLDLLTVTKDTSTGIGAPGNGTGKVTSSPAAISCGSACLTQNASFADGATVVLYAVADPNNIFLGWGGDCAAAGTALSCTLTMNAAKNVTVKFTACGNGTLDAQEGCDDGAANGAPGDRCDSQCKIVNGQPCNQGASGLRGNPSCESNICNTAPGLPGICSAPNLCGNGRLEAGEGCDDGNTTSGDGCSSSCKVENTFPCNATAPGLTGNASCVSGICDTLGFPAPGRCEPANLCGNGVLEAGEGCDDGNIASGDGCSSSCRVENTFPCNATAPGLTGNASCASGICDTLGFPAPGRCEPANLCGNGVLEAGEGCDDGNIASGDGCDSMCKIENGRSCNATAPGATGNLSCESGICNATGGAPGVCSASNTCGNGKLEAGEGCDDGNTASGDGCDSMCKIENGRPCNATAPGATGDMSCESGICNATGGAPGVCSAPNACGNGKLEAGEGCDDGNTTSGDGCDSMCKIETGRPCNATPPGATGDASCESGICNASRGAPGVCSAPNACGNGKLEAGEGCDDGNTTSGDGCDSMCKIENGRPCNTMAPGVTGNASCESGLCKAQSGGAGVCSPTNTCGNGKLEAGEGCDDGNTTSGDGCDSTCKIENGHPCNTKAPGATGNASCESNLCSGDGQCVPAGSCDVDADCSGGKWCNESAHLCTPKLPNFTPVPTDPPHKNPTLNGMCTDGAAKLTCQSGVCDSTDNQCGYGDGHGHCTSADAQVVCRSGRCAPDGTCGSGCTRDADCTDPQHPSCDVATHSCKAAGNAGFDGGGFCSYSGHAPPGGAWTAAFLLFALAGLVGRARSRARAHR